VSLLARRQKDLKSRSASNPDIPVLLTKDRSGSVSLLGSVSKERCESFDNNYASATSNSYNHHLSHYPGSATASSSSSPSSSPSAPSSAGSSYALITPRLVRRRSSSAESPNGKQTVSKERSASTDSTKHTPRGGNNSGRKGSMDAVSSSLSSFVSGGGGSSSSLSGISEESDVSALNTPRGGGGDDEPQDGGRAGKKDKKKDKKEKKKDNKKEREEKRDNNIGKKLKGKRINSMIIERNSPRGASAGARSGSIPDT
jgi:hypothetical protein